MKLSIVLGGRDDNYGYQFMDRLHQAVSSNLRLLDNSKIDYEMIVVDFNPIEEHYLYQNSIIKKTLTHPKIKNIIVDNSVIVAENLPALCYYEYFAKNAGIRKSTGDFILLINSDIVLSSKLIEVISEEMVNPEADDYFYRTRYRGEIPLGTQPQDDTETNDLYEASINSDKICGETCGQSSGDATMFSRKVMFRTATGYYEKDQRHRTEKSQVHMDTEIVWNCRQKGKQLRLLEAPYYHISHERPHQRDAFFATYSYSNDPNWGYIDYQTREMNKNTQMIFV
jgi:hypothetical protein